MTKNLYPGSVDIIIAGTQKAATSSLQRYIGEHPDVITHPSLEFTYFVLEEEWKQGYEKRYKIQFGDHIDHSKKVLAKNVGIMYFEHALQHLKEHNPNVKIIIVLRNPVDRAYSAFWYAKSRGHESIDSFEEALHGDPNRNDTFVSKGMVDYLGRGNYAEQIEMVYRYFDRSQVLIMLQEDMKKDMKTLIKDVFDFVGLDNTFTPDLEKKYNESSKSIFPTLSRWLRNRSPIKSILKTFVSPKVLSKAKNKVSRLNSEIYTPPPMKPETRNQLVEHYKSHNERLGKMINRDLSSWNK